MRLPFAFGLTVVIITDRIAMMMMMVMMIMMMMMMMMRMLMKTEDCCGDDNKSSTHIANIDLHYHHHSFVLADSHSTLLLHFMIHQSHLLSCLPLHSSISFFSSPHNYHTAL